MRVRAKVSFAGTVTMYTGEVGEIGEGETLADLLAAGHVEPVEEPKKEGPRQAGEGKSAAKDKKGE